MSSTRNIAQYSGKGTESVSGRWSRKKTQARRSSSRNDEEGLKWKLQTYDLYWRKRTMWSFGWYIFTCRNVKGAAASRWLCSIGALRCNEDKSGTGLYPRLLRKVHTCYSVDGQVVKHRDVAERLFTGGRQWITRRGWCARDRSRTLLPLPKSDRYDRNGTSIDFRGRKGPVCDAQLKSHFIVPLGPRDVPNCTLVEVRKRYFISLVMS